jgi:energy-coupling factor transporter ATP-binding protein EcfA2
MQLKIHNGKVDLSGVPILTDINVEINTTSRIAIVGRNGCGKTTLIKAIAGIIPLANTQADGGFMAISGKPTIGMLDQLTFNDETVPMVNEIRSAYADILELKDKFKLEDAIEAKLIHGEQALGYYATVSTVAVLVQAMVTMIFTPLIGVFNEAYNDGDKKRVTGLLLKLVALLTGVTLVAMIAIYFLGDFAMTLVFGEGIRPYVYLLYPTVIASCITAFMWLMGMLLVVMRDTRTLMGGAIVGIVLSVTLCLLLIPDSCYTGANIAIITALSLISIIYLIRLS